MCVFKCYEIENMFIIGIGCDLDFLNKQLHVYLWVFFYFRQIEPRRGVCQFCCG